MNVCAFWKPTLGKMDMTVFAGVDNIADVKYSSFGIDYEQYWMPNFYYPMPGITFKGGLSINF
jgi:outer membrane receptor protein involved in Fe transport